MTTKYRIHPAIGVARVGDSKDFYIGPEKAGALPVNRDGSAFTETDFRDNQGALKRQGVRFRVFQITDDDPVGAPLVLDGEVTAVEWHVHVANKKSAWYEFATNEGEYGYSPDHPLRNANVKGDDRKALIIDPGPRTLNASNRNVSFDRHSIPDGYPGQFPTGLKPFGIDTLGDALLEDDGALLVLGGHGRSGSNLRPAVITQYANNDGWFDDTSDGSVQAVLVMKDGRRVVLDEHASVLCGPPAYAPEILNLVTLYDTMLDTFVLNFGYKPEVFANQLWNADYKPSFEQDIQPILERAFAYKWVVAIPPHPHKLDWQMLGDPDPDFNAMRSYYLDHLRSPDQGNVMVNDAGVPMMPWLAGDNALEPDYLSSKYLTFNRTQYFYMQQWAKGCFVRSREPQARGGEALDEGVLENCVGGAFSPGIEMTWICREPRIYERAFRIKQRAVCAERGLTLGVDFDLGLEPGDLTHYMAVPWQADFNECSSQPIGDRYLWWWPAQRPLHVRNREKPNQVVGWAGTIENQKASDYLAYADDLDMVKHWAAQGFILNIGDEEDPQFVQVAKGERSNNT